MAPAFINFFVFTFYVSPKLERASFFTLTFQVLVVGVCNQLFQYLDSNILKPATVIRVFFSFFFKLVTIHRVLIVSIFKAPKKNKTTQSVQIDL